MKLEHDLIRDVLLYLEKNCVSNTDTNGTITFANNPINWKQLYEDDALNAKYDIDDIKYCLVVLYEAGFFEARTREVRGGYHSMLIRDLTWKGRTFVENISDDTIWDKVKHAFCHLTRVSLETMVASVPTMILHHIR